MVWVFWVLAIVGALVFFVSGHGWWGIACTVAAIALYKHQRGKPAPLVMANLPGPGLYAFDIVGEAHYQDALEAICGGRTPDGAEKYVQATIHLENDNPHDDMAVRVDIGGRTVGYFSRGEARNYRKQIEGRAPGEIVGTCKAVITGGWAREDSIGKFGVRLDLPVQ